MTDRDSVEIKAPSQANYDELVNVTASVFRPNEPQSWVDRCNEGYIAGSSYDWDASRVAFIDGELVAHVGVWRLNLRIGSAELLCGGIGAVGTLPVCRGRRIASGLMKSVMQAMADGGYVISSMYGRGNFYGRYGYVPVFSRSYAVAESFNKETDEKIRLNEDIAALLEVKLSRRDGEMTDLLTARGEIGRIYQAGRKYLSLTADRPVYTLNCNRQIRLCELVDGGGQICGYISYSVEDEHLTVHELGGFDTPEARRELLGQIYHLAIDNQRSKARVNIPRTHPMMALLRRYDSAYNEYFHADGNAMVAVVDLKKTLESLKPELEARIAASPVNIGDFALNLGVDDKCAAIKVTGGAVSVCDSFIDGAATFKGHDLPRLLLGSVPAAEVAEAGQIDCDATTLDKLDVLFPTTDPRLPDAEYH